METNRKDSPQNTLTNTEILVAVEIRGISGFLGMTTAFGSVHIVSFGILEIINQRYICCTVL